MCVTVPRLCLDEPVLEMGRDCLFTHAHPPPGQVPALPNRFVDPPVPDHCGCHPTPPQKSSIGLICCSLSQVCVCVCVCAGFQAIIGNADVQISFARMWMQMLDVGVFHFLERSPVPALIHPSCRPSELE